MHTSLHLLLHVLGRYSHKARHLLAGARFGSNSTRRNKAKQKGDDDDKHELGTLHNWHTQRNLEMLAAHHRRYHSEWSMPMHTSSTVGLVWREISHPGELSGMAFFN